MTNVARKGESLNSSPLGENKTFRGCRSRRKYEKAYGLLESHYSSMNRSKIKLEDILDLKNCEAAIVNASKNKAKRRHQEERRYARTGKVVRYSVINVLKNKKEFAVELQSFIYGLLYGDSRFHQGNICIINNDGSHKKQRELCKPRFFPDQCAHWAIMQIVAPVLTKGFYKYSCASIMGRGTHYAKRAVDGFLKDISATKYCAQLDIKGFYKNINKETLIGLFSKKIKDKRIVKLLSAIVYSYEKEGLPLGYYTSAIFANFYLTPVDRFIKEQLSVEKYARYMDDMIMFSSNKKKLHKAKNMLLKFLATLSLSLKYNWQIYKLPYKTNNQRDVDFVGFRFFRFKTIIRKSIFLRIRRLIFKLLHRKYTPKRARAFYSYNGYFKYTDSRKVMKKYVFGRINLYKIKEIISNESRKEHCIKLQTA